VVSTHIYWSARPETGRLPDYGTASALSMLLVVTAFLLIHIYQRQVRRAERFVTVTGRGYRPRRVGLGRWQAPIFVLALLFVLIAVALPLFMLVWRSLLRVYVYPSGAALALLNLNAYRAVLGDPDVPLVLANTGIVAFGAAAVVCGLAAAVAWQVVRGTVRARWRRLLGSLAFAPQAFPSIVIGLGLIFTYLWIPLPIYGTVAILLIAMVTKYLAFASGTMVAAQMQIARELEEASLIAGAGRWRTYRRVVAPLLAPALAACWLWVVIHVVRELGLALMLYSLSSQVLSTKIWLLWENGRVADACATGVLTVAALVVLLALTGIWRWSGRTYARLGADRPAVVPAGGAP
jgi:iron(III) transport system permease protein